MGGQYGYYTDLETGYILCTHRYYDPAGGRWLTRDPIEYSGGMNLYAYVSNNPVNKIDPLGLMDTEPGYPKKYSPPPKPIAQIFVGDIECENTLIYSLDQRRQIGMAQAQIDGQPILPGGVMMFELIGEAL